MWCYILNIYLVQINESAEPSVNILLAAKSILCYTNISEYVCTGILNGSKLGYYPVSLMIQNGELMLMSII